jgi:hypothetical protein
MEYITAKEAAEILRLNQSTIQSAIKNELFPGQRRGSKPLPLALIRKIARELTAPDRLTGAEVAARLGISKIMYHQYLRRGNLKPVSVPVFTYHWRYYRFAVEDVDRLLAERQARYNKSSNRFKFTTNLLPPPRQNEQTS